MKVRGQILLLTFLIFSHASYADDWPQWRHDAKRSGATEEELAQKLKQQWMLSLGKPAPAYEHQYRMCADFSYSPVAADGMLFVPSSVTDQVMAFDLETGDLKWHYVTDGPVRFAPVHNKGKLYFASDDGYLYCVDSKNGKLLWRQRGVPKEIPDMLMLVNGRMVSRWPARGAPVLSGGIIYFGAGIWPEEGSYQNAVDAETGELVWQSDALSIIKEGMCDHGTNHDLSLPPHGYPAVINNKLAVTSGRTLAAWFDLKSGKMDPYTCFYVKFSVPRGTWYLAGNDDFWVQGGNWFAAHSDAAPPKPAEMRDTTTPLIWSRKSPESAEFVLKNRPFMVGDKPNGLGTGAGYENLYSEPIITEDTAFASVFDDGEKYMLTRGHTFVKFRPFDKIVARDLKKPKWRAGKTAVDSGKRATARVATIEFPVKWEMATPLRALIKAGSHLIAGEKDRIAAIAIPKNGETPRISWEAKIEGNPVNTLLADGKLVTVTDTGNVYCFGTGAESKAGIPVTEKVEMSPKNGYAFVLGWGDGRKALELAKDPDWRVVILEKDSAKVAESRKVLNKLGLYGRRAQVIPARENIELTPYWANCVVVNDATLFGTPEETLSVTVNTLRPFTGKMSMDSSVDQKIVKKLVSGKTDYKTEKSTLYRISAPAGAADWTHESADADNSFISKDKLVKWPLGVLWYSGDIDRFFTPEAHFQHERTPYPLIKGGRMFIITHDLLHAIDIYTGNYLWEAKMPMTGYVKTRLLDNRLYGRPTERNYVLSNDLIYCVTGKDIYSFDVETGKQNRTIPIPEQLEIEAKESVGKTTTQKIKETGESLLLQPIPEWTEVRLWENLLIAKAGKHLVAIDRHSGRVEWSRKGALEYTTYTIGDNRLYGVDCIPDSYAKKQKQHEKRGELFALEPASGAELWKRDIHYLSWPELTPPGVRVWMKPPMPFLGYNAKHKLLVIAYNGNNIIVSNARDGSELWTLKNPEMEKDRRIYTPNILDDYLMLSLSKYTGGMGFLVDIRTGKKLQDECQVPRARTCGRLIGNGHLLTYRDAATELYDMDSDRTIPFNSTRAGCTTSFIPANGVMSAPMFGHGCVCNYPMFSSLALYHMPGSESMRPQAVQQSWERK